MKWKYTTEVELPVMVRILSYNPGCEGSPKTGPLRSYQDIVAPEPEECEFEVYMGDQKLDIPDELYNELYKDVLEKAREMHQYEKEKMAELKAEKRMEELQEKRMMGK